MRRRHARPAVAAAVGVLAVVAAGGCTTPAESTPEGSETVAGVSAETTPAPKPLVVETVFDHSTLDPTKTFDRSGAMLSRALYETLTTLDPDDPTKVVPGPELDPGDQGGAITMIQEMLKDLGYAVDVTGAYNEATTQVVTAFQRHFRPARVDGIADHSTLETLKRLLAARDALTPPTV